MNRSQWHVTMQRKAKKAKSSYHSTHPQADERTRVRSASTRPTPTPGLPAYSAIHAGTPRRGELNAMDNLMNQSGSDHAVRRRPELQLIASDIRCSWGIARDAAARVVSWTTVGL